jgi:hypothetical protein
MHGLTPKHTPAPGRSGLTPAQICAATDCAHSSTQCTHLHRDRMGSGVVRTSSPGLNKWAHPLPASATRNGAVFLCVVCPSASAAQDPSMAVRTRACTHTLAHAHTSTRPRTQTNTSTRTHARTHTRAHPFKRASYQWPRFKWDRRTGDATIGTVPHPGRLGRLPSVCSGFFEFSTIRAGLWLFRV